MENVIKMIEDASSVTILAHESEDADAVGSCFALRLALLAMGKNVVCCFSEKLRWKLDFLGSDYDVADENTSYDHDLCICLDCGDLKRLGKREHIFLGAKHTVSIDHHATNTAFAEVNYVDSKAPATGEIIYKLLRRMGAEITPQIAYNLYAAISSDTGSFKYSNVTPETLCIVADILKTGIDHAEIARYLYDTEPLSVIRFKGCLMNSLEQYAEGRLCMVTLSDKLLKEYGLLEGDVDDAVNIARSTKGCQIAVSVRETQEKIKISFRSNGKFDVSQIAERFGGGGHKMAAGAAVFGKTLDTVKADVIKACEEYING